VRNVENSGLLDRELNTCGINRLNMLNKWRASYKLRTDSGRRCCDQLQTHHKLL